MVLAIGLYTAYAFWSDAGKFAEAVRRIGVREGALVLALSLVNYALRCARWRIFLGRLGHALAWGPGILNYASGFALTTTPGKAGEAIRSVQLKERFDVPVADSLAAFFAERFSDVLALTILAALAFRLLPGGDWIAGGVVLVVATALLVAASESRTAAFARVLSCVAPARWAQPVASMLAQAGRLTRGATLGTGLVLSLVAWAAEGYALYLIVNAMGVSVDAITGIGIYCAALLAGALFFLPGGLGSTEAFLVLLLLGCGMDPAMAGAATVVSRVTTLWFAVALGWIALGLWTLREPAPRAR